VEKEKMDEPQLLHNSEPQGGTESGGEEGELDEPQLLREASAHSIVRRLILAQYKGTTARISGGSCRSTGWS
jgi:hypothetical protein